MSFVVLIGLVVVTVFTLAVGQGTNQTAALATVVFFPSAIALYFCPAIIARLRQHPKVAAIAVLNFLGGWTILGWVGAMVWAYADGAEP